MQQGVYAEVIACPRDLSAVSVITLGEIKPVSRNVLLYIYMPGICQVYGGNNSFMYFLSCQGRALVYCLEIGS